MTPNFSDPITITSGTEVSKDCIVYFSGAIGSVANVTRTIAVNNNSVVDASINTATGYATNNDLVVLPLKSGDKPTYQGYATVKGFGLL